MNKVSLFFRILPIVFAAAGGSTCDFSSFSFSFSFSFCLWMGGDRLRSSRNMTLSGVTVSFWTLILWASDKGIKRDVAICRWRSSNVEETGIEMSQFLSSSV